MLGAVNTLSVVIPAYNESGRIERTLAAVTGYLRRHFDHWELVVVDDGSTDDTAAVVQDFAARDPASAGRVRLVANPKNLGKGGAVRRGVLEAALEWVLVSDADLSTPIEELSKLAAHSGEAPVVIGSRGMAASQILRRQPLYRELMGRGFNVLVQCAALPGISDTQCGFKLFRRSAAVAVFSRLTIEGFGFDVEALWLARRLGFEIREVPVVWLDDPATKVRPLRDAWRMAGDLARVRWRHRRAPAGGA
jgi:dolichyl-phosphate beta-glucosyltransferase